MSENSVRHFTKVSMWMVLTLLLGAIVAPCVRADSVTFTCYTTGGCVAAPPTAPDVTFSASGTTLDITWYSQTFDLTLPSDWSDTDSMYWGASNSDFIIGDNNHLADLEPSVYPINTTLPSGAGISEGGMIIFTPGTVAPTPEPGTSALMLLGTGLVLVMRKLIARGLPQAS